MANTNQPKRFSNRTITILCSLLVGAVIIALLSYERIDVLYLLSTIGLVVLLCIVAFSDLERKTTEN